MRQVEKRVLGMPGDRRRSTPASASSRAARNEITEDAVGVDPVRVRRLARARGRRSASWTSIRAMTGIPGVVVEVTAPQRRPADRQADPGAALARSIPTGLPDAAKQGRRHRCAKRPGRQRPRRRPAAARHRLEARGRPGRGRASTAPARRTVGTAVQLVTNGLKLTEYRPAGTDEAVDILRAPPGGPAQPRPARRAARPDPVRLVPIGNFVERNAGADASASSTASTATRVDHGLGQRRRGRADRQGAAGGRRRARRRPISAPASPGS